LKGKLAYQRFHVIKKSWFCFFSAAGQKNNFFPVSSSENIYHKFQGKYLSMIILLR